jgi:hypothetical protein
MEPFRRRDKNAMIVVIISLPKAYSNQTFAVLNHKHGLIMGERILELWLAYSLTLATRSASITIPQVIGLPGKRTY